MKVQIFKLKQANGFTLYERAKTKIKGYAAWPKYFINNVDGEKNYFKEFKTIKEANKEFERLTTQVKAYINNHEFLLNPAQTHVNIDGQLIEIMEDQEGDKYIMQDDKTVYFDHIN